MNQGKILRILGLLCGLAFFSAAAFALPDMDLHFGGSGALNWRNIGPRYPHYETQIQDEVYLSDMYLQLGGKASAGVPFLIEGNWPTSSEGQMRLNQLLIEYDRLENFKIQFGKFLVPFGRYNELYRANDFLTVTRPLLFASPDSLDLVVRLNSPRPALTVGYTDVGARVSYYPHLDYRLAPTELTAFIVNGLGEQTNRLRTFPNTDNIGVPPVPGNGSNIDFGHINNNLADNNNPKAVGARLVFALGDVGPPWPIPEGIFELTNVELGLSAMGSQYDLDQSLNYRIYNADLNFHYKGLDFVGAYVYEQSDFKAPSESAPATAPYAFGPPQIADHEINQGYFIQMSFPILRHPKWGSRLSGALVFNQMWRTGPVMDLFYNPKVDNVTYPSLLAYNTFVRPRATTRIDKWTAALNYRLTDHLGVKCEYSYWTLKRSSAGSVYGTSPFEPNTTLAPHAEGLFNVYQTALSLVAGF